MRWSTPELCVAPAGTSTGSPVEATACGRFGEPMQSWDFETLGSEVNRVRARLRSVATGHCLTVPRTQLELGDIPRLEPTSDHRVLTWTPIDDGVRFDVRELAADATPGLDQIFDFAF
jgi:hypothetical protein